MAPKKGSGLLARLLDFDEQFTFYGAYHDNLVNKLIHILCVWPILLTALVGLWRTPELPYPQLHAPASLEIHDVAIKFNGAFLATALYVAFYLALEFKNFSRLTGVGALAAALAVACYLFAGHLHQEGSITLPFSLDGRKGGMEVETWKFAAVLHAVCWAAQFVGHGVFEGRRPALLDNVAQAFFMAPVFVLLEAIFLVGGKKDLRDELQYRVDKAIVKHQEERKTQAILKTPGRVTRSRSKKL